MAPDNRPRPDRHRSLRRLRPPLPGLSPAFSGLSGVIRRPKPR
jgi:hypothetical protein